MKNKINFLPLKYYLKSNVGGCWGEDPVGDINDRIILRSTEQGQNGKLKIESPAVRNLTPIEFESCRLKANDIIITKSSGSPQHIGKSSIITPQIEELECAFSNFIQRIRVDEQVVSPQYLQFALNSDFVKCQFQLLTNSTVGLGNLNSEVIGNVSIPFLSLEIQTKIADYLDRKTAELDQLIGEKQRLLKLLDEKKRALIARAVTRGLNPDAPLKDSGIPWLGKIPEHWKIERARWLFLQSELPVRKEDKMVTCFRDGTVTLRSNRREDGFTNAVLELGYQGIRKGQLVLHSMDAFAGAIGVSDSDGKCTPEYVICDSTTDENEPNYYGFLLREMALQKFIQAQCSAVRERAPRIRFNQFKDFELPVPPIEEQKSIVMHIKQAMRSLEQLQKVAEKTINLLQERRTALISAAVTGKLKEAYK